MTVFALLLLMATAIFVASSLKFEEDISALLPTDAQNEDLQEVLKTAKFNDKVIVMLEHETNESDALVDATKGFINRLKRDTTYIKTIQGELTAETITEAQNFVYDNLPLFLRQNDYDYLEKELTPNQLSERLIQLKKDLRSPMGAISSRGYRKDPFELRLRLLPMFQDLQLENNLALHEGILMTKDKTTSVLFIDLKVSSQDGSQSEAVVNFLNAERQKFLSNAAHEQISVSMIGGVFYNVSNAKQIKSDIQTTLTIAGTLLLLILIVFFRSFKVPVLLFLPTVFGAIIALAILELWKHQVSAIALGVGSIILGISLDYALHTLTHLRNSNSIREVFQAITKPIILSSFTTAIAFLCLIFVGSDALESLGVFAAISVVLAAFFALVIIPLIFSAEKYNVQKTTVLDRLANVNFHQNRMLVAVIFIASVVGAFFVNQVKFETDLNELNFQTESLKQAEKQLNRTTQYYNYTNLYLISYDEVQNIVFEQNAVNLSNLKLLKDDGMQLSYSSIGDIVPSEYVQENRLKNWNSFWTDEKKLNHQESLESFGESLGFRKDIFQPWLKQIGKTFTLLDLDDFNTIPSFSIDNFISQGERFTTISTPVSVNNSDLDSFVAFFNDTENVFVINRESLNDSLLGQLKNTFNNLLLFSIIAVFLVMLTFFRSVWLSLLTLLPIALSWFLTLGVMVLFGLQFNVFNIIICSFIFGLGVDFAIFMTNGVIFEDKSTSDILNTYKTSILLSVITTLLGMGALIFAKHPALQSVAMVSIIGIFSALIVSFTVHPCILKQCLLFKNRKNA